MTEVTPAVQSAVFHWGDLATWVGAIATFLAVLVALRLHTRVFPPSLTLELVSADGETTTVGLASTDDEGGTKIRPEKCRFYHVRLSNRRPWSGATDAAVQVLKIETIDASGTNFIPVWAGILSVSAAHYGVHPNRILGAAPQDYDLCSVVRGKWVELHPARVIPNNFPHKSRSVDGRPVRLRVTLQAHSLEVLSPFFVFDISWDGQWDDDTIKMRQHMVVHSLSGQKE